MPKSGIKGNRGNANPKLRSENMDALLVADKQLAEANPNSPAVNKRNMKLMASAEKGEAIAQNLVRVADLISNEIYDRTVLKNSVAVDLDDTTAVMERSRDYFTACATAKNPPSMLTYYSIGLGLTQVRVCEFMRKHPSHPSTEFIMRVRDLIADQITTGAMYGNLDNIMAIFQLKNLHGFADNVRIEAAMPESAPEIDEDALAKEYEAYAKANGIKIPPKDITNEQ